jgi:hypothetical protein
MTQDSIGERIRTQFEKIAEDSEKNAIEAANLASEDKHKRALEAEVEYEKDKIRKKVFVAITELAIEAAHTYTELDLPTDIIVKNGKTAYGFTGFIRDFIGNKDLFGWRIQSQTTSYTSTEFQNRYGNIQATYERTNGVCLGTDGELVTYKNDSAYGLGTYDFSGNLWFRNVDLAGHVDLNDTEGMLLISKWSDLLMVPTIKPRERIN